jgi:hypothetical protein
MNNYSKVSFTEEEQTPWPESADKLYRLCDRRLSAKSFIYPTLIICSSDFVGVYLLRILIHLQILILESIEKN